MFEHEGHAVNWPALILGSVVVALLLPGSKKLQKGKVYAATFQPPEGSLLSEDTLAKLKSILPPGSLIAVGDGGTLIVTFTAVNDQEIGDFPTPLGIFKLLSLHPV